MNPSIQQMLNRYTCENENDYINAIREIMQELALQGLWRGSFLNMLLSRVDGSAHSLRLNRVRRIWFSVAFPESGVPLDQHTPSVNGNLSHLAFQRNL